MAMQVTLWVRKQSQLSLECRYVLERICDSFPPGPDGILRAKVRDVAENLDSLRWIVVENIFEAARGGAIDIINITAKSAVLRLKIPLGDLQ